MAGVTDTQSLRFGQVGDVITHAMVKNLADDIATQLDAADVARTAALKRPYARVARNAGLSIPVTTIVTVPWDVELSDSHAMVDIPTQPTRVTASATAGQGVYMVQCGIQGFYTGWSRGDLILYKNGAFHSQRCWYAPQDLDVLSLTAMVNLGTVGDYLTLNAYHEGGGTTSTIDVYMRVFKVSE